MQSHERLLVYTNLLHALERTLSQALYFSMNLLYFYLFIEIIFEVLTNTVIIH